MSGSGGNRGRAPALALGLALALVALAPIAGADDLYLDGRESFASESPKIEIVRPDADWKFVDIAIQRRDAERADPAAGRAFDDLVARLHHPPTRGTVSVYVFPTRGARLDLAALEASARADVARLKKGEVLEQSRGAIGGREAVRTDYTGVPEGARGVAAGTVFFFSRIDALSPETAHAVAIIFEVPRDRSKAALAGWRKVLKKLKLA
jgi:hypothetical protein